MFPARWTQTSPVQPAGEERKVEIWDLLMFYWRLWCAIEKYKGFLCSSCPQELISQPSNNLACGLWEKLRDLQDSGVSVGPATTSTQGSLTEFSSKRFCSTPDLLSNSPFWKSDYLMRPFLSVSIIAQSSAISGVAYRYTRENIASAMEHQQPIPPPPPPPPQQQQQLCEPWR